MSCPMACVFCRLRVESGGEALDSLCLLLTSCGGGEAMGESVDEAVDEAVDRLCQLKLSCVKASYTRTARHLLARTSAKLV